MNGESAPKGGALREPAAKLGQSQFSRIEQELSPRLKALSSTLAAVLVGFVDFDEVGPSLLKLSMAAEQQAEVAAGEAELRRTA